MQVASCLRKMVTIMVFWVVVVVTELHFICNSAVKAMVNIAPEAGWTIEVIEEEEE